MAEVKFKFVGDDSELRKKLADLANIQSTMSEKFTRDFGKSIDKGLANSMKEAAKEAVNAARETEVLNRTASNKDVTNAKIDQINAIKELHKQRSKEIGDLNALKQIEQEAKASLAEKKVATELLTQAQKEANVELAKSRKESIDRASVLREQAEARRKASEEERKALKVVKDAEKARKDAEREAAKQAREVEKRRKQLEKENSEYYKLNSALGNVRKQAKDVGAEMFRLERQGYKNTAGYEALRKKSEALTKQTQYLDTGIKKIDASLGLHQRNVGNYGEAMEQISPIISDINRKLSLFGTSIDELATKPGAIKELGAAFASIGKSIMAFLMTPVGAAVAILGSLFMLFQRNKQTVIDFNDGLLNVSKTTGITGAALQSLSDDIIKLSRSLQTVGTDKLLEYATVAGQLGVKGTQNILAFTEALAKLETASDISGEEGGAQIARLLTLVDGGVQNVKAFGDEIVNLGNNFPATEAEILANSTSIAQNTGLYKLGRQEVLAYGTATKSVGIEAELAGSKIGKALKTISTSIRTGKNLETFAKLTGIEVNKLGESFRNNSGEVLFKFIEGLNKIDKAGGDVGKTLADLGIKEERLERVVGSLATGGFDTLKMSLENVSNAAGAMDEEFETAAGKLVNQTNRIGIAWDNLVLTIENGQGAIGKASVAIVGAVADILEAFTAVASSNSIKEFFARFGQFSNLEGMKATGKAAGDAIRFENDNPNAVRGDLTSYKEMRDFYKATREEQEKMLAAQEEVIKLKSKEYQQDKSQAKLNDLNWNAERLAKMRGTLATPGGAVISPAATTEDAEQDEKAKRAAERLAEQRRQATERQRALQLSIDQANEKAHRNQLTRDEQEVASIRDKYAKIREEARKFHDDPKNKGLRVDLGGLQASENFEVSEATTRQGTVELVKSLNEQKGLVDEYNRYVESTSVQSANERYTKELEIIKGYKDRLQAEYLDIITLEQTASGDGFTGSTVKLTQAQEERAKQLKDMLDSLDKEEANRERQRYINALNASQTYNDKRLAIEQKYAQMRTSLGSDLTPERAEVFDRNQSNELSKLATDQLANTDAWGMLFGNLDEFTAQQLDVMINEIEARFDDLQVDFNPIDLQAVRQKLREARAIVIADNPFAQVGAAIRNVFSKSGDDTKKSANDIKRNWTELARSTEASFDFVRDAIDSAEFLKDAIGDVGNTALMSMMAVATTAIAVSAAIKTAEKASVVLAIIQAALVVVNAIAGIFKSIFNAQDKRIEKSIESKKLAVEDLDRAFQNLDRSMSRAVGENFYKVGQEQIKNLEEQRRITEQMVRDEQSKKKSDQAKVQEYKDELQNIDNKIQDINQSILDQLVQTTFKDFSNDLTDALVSAFEAGENALDKLDDQFSKFIKNAVVNSLQLKMIQPIIDQIINSVGAYMKANDNSVIGFNFDPWREILQDAGADFIEALNSTYEGLGLTKDSKKRSETSEGIAGITEQTANRLEAEFGGMRIAQLQMLEETKTNGMTMREQLRISSSSLESLIAIQNNTFRTANNTDRLAGIETAIVALNNKVTNNDALRRGAGF